MQDAVIEGAFQVLAGFDAVQQSTEAMKATVLDEGEQLAYAGAALALRYDGPGQRAPITAGQINQARRAEDTGADLWRVMNRCSENALRGGQPGMSANQRRVRTRPVQGIDRNVGLNRALWVLAEEMRRLKAA